MKKMKKTAALLIAVAMLLGACSGNSTKPADTGQPVQPSGTATQAPTDTNTNDVKPPAEESKPFVNVILNELSTMNYLISNKSVDSEYGSAFFMDALVQNDEFGRMVPGVAKEWSVGDDLVTWTVKLRDDVKWFRHDGTEYGQVTADDYVSAMAYVLDKNNASLIVDMITGFIKGAKSYYNGETTDFSTVGIKAVDQFTIEYTLERPTTFFPSLLTYTSYLPLNKQFFEEVGADKFGTDFDKILYCGPYLCKSWQRDKEKVYVANPNYYQADRVHVPEIVWNIVDDTRVGLELYKRGEVSAFAIPSALLDSVMNDPELMKEVYMVDPTASVYYFGFNFSSTNTNFSTAAMNINFRKAFYHGFNRTGWLVLSNPYEPEKLKSNLIVAPDVAVSPTGKDYVTYGKLPEIAARETLDMGLAKEYIEKAKAELGNSVTWPVNIVYPVASNEAGAESGSLFKMLLEDAFPGDLTVELKPYAAGTYYDMLDTRAWDMTSQGWGPDYADPSTYLDAVLPGGVSDRFDLGLLPETQEYARLMGIAAEKYDIDERFEAYAEAEAYLIDNAILVPYRFNGGNYAISKLRNPYAYPRAAYGLTRYSYLDRIYGDTALSTEERNELKAKFEQEKAAIAAGK